MKSTEKEVDALLKKYEDMLYRIAFSNVKNKEDAEDAVQEVFFRYLRSKPVFENDVHEKAWFIRVTINICYDMQKNAWATKTVALDKIPESERRNFSLPYELSADNRLCQLRVEEDETLWKVMGLPAGYQNVLYLFYYEDYSIKEISDIMELEENTVKTRLRRGREMLRKIIEKRKP